MGLEQKLIDLKESSLANVRNVLMRNERLGNDGVKGMCMDAWKAAVAQALKEGDSQAALNALNQQLNEFKGEQAQKRKSVMARMGAEQDSGLIAMTFNCWLQFHQNYA